MKQFWIMCLLCLGLFATAMSCGPKHRYCPDDPEMECRPNTDAAPNTGTGGMMDRGPCDGGSVMQNPDGSVTCLPP
jgi:hypothetical protein